MKIRKLLYIAALTAMLLTGAPQTYAAGQSDAAAENAIEMEDAAMECVEAMLRQYVPWVNVEYSGKLRIPGVSISPTIRMYMENGKLIQISARVPLIGEVARIEITPQTILAINKFKKTYCQESMQHLLSFYPGFITDVQSIFLGRVVIVGEGEYSEANRMSMQMQRSEDGDWLVYPKEQPAGGRVKYGYVVQDNGRTADLFAMMDGQGYSATISYVYPGSGIEMEAKINAGKKQYSGVLDFESVKWGGTRLSEVNLSKYQKMGIEDFLKSIKF